MKKSYFRDKKTDEIQPTDKTWFLNQKIRQYTSLTP